MKKIIKNPEESTILLKEINDKSFVGCIISNNKFIIVNKRHFGKFLFTRMNDLFIVLEDNKESMQELLNSLFNLDAYKFETRKEMLNWLLK